MQYEHITRVGRYTTVDTGNATETLHDGSPGITLEELGRLERRAAIAVLTEIDTLEGAELRFTRKALDMSQAELAETLGVTREDVQRWESAVDVIEEETRTALLRLLNAEGFGERPASYDASDPLSPHKTRITIRPDQLGGAPCLRGLRIAVSVVVDMVGQGMADGDLGASGMRRVPARPKRFTASPVPGRVGRVPSRSCSNGPSGWVP